MDSLTYLYKNTFLKDFISFSMNYFEFKEKISTFEQIKNAFLFIGLKFYGKFSIILSSFN